MVKWFFPVFPGDDPNQGCDCHHEGEDSSRDPERGAGVDGQREVLLHLVHGPRQDLHDAVPTLAERPHGTGINCF